MRNANCYIKDNSRSEEFFDPKLFFSTCLLSSVVFGACPKIPLFVRSERNCWKASCFVRRQNPLPRPALSNKITENPALDIENLDSGSVSDLNSQYGCALAPPGAFFT